MNILLIEDDDVLADGLIHTLTNSGYRVTCATTGAYAEHLLQAQGFDLILILVSNFFLRSKEIQIFFNCVLVQTFRKNKNFSFKNRGQGNHQLTKKYQKAPNKTWQV